MSQRSEKKAATNRANAQNSTGPRTEAGKAKVRYNALRHGLLSEKVLYAHEEPQKYRRFAEKMQTELDPQGAVEELLTERIVTSAWRLRRCLWIETKVAESNCIVQDDITGLPTFTDVGTGFIKDGFASDAITRLCRYETMIERSLLKAMYELERVQARRRGFTVTPPGVLDVFMSDDGDPASP
jgi:hypothetical protein